MAVVEDKQEKKKDVGDCTGNCVGVIVAILQESFWTGKPLLSAAGQRTLLFWAVFSMQVKQMWKGTKFCKETCTKTDADIASFLLVSPGSL